MPKKMKAEEMYATMNPWRLFFVVALPGMISMFAMSIYSIVEGIFIGQILGEAAFAAINIAFPMVMINFSLADLIGVGASVPISVSLGRGDHETANNVFSCSVILIFFTSLVMGCIMFFAAEPLARMMGANDVLLDTSVRYLRTCAVCSPLTAVFFAMDNYLRISGYVKTSMVINICCNLMTIALIRGNALACGIEALEQDGSSIRIFPSRINIDVWMELSDLFEGSLKLVMSGRNYINLYLRKEPKPLELINKVLEAYIRVAKELAAGGSAQ